MAQPRGNRGRTVVWPLSAGLIWVGLALVAAEPSTARRPAAAESNAMPSMAPGMVTAGPGGASSALGAAGGAGRGILREAPALARDVLQLVRGLSKTPADCACTQWGDILRRRMHSPRSAIPWYARAIGLLERRPADVFSAEGFDAGGRFGGEPARSAFGGMARAQAAVGQARTALTCLEQGRGRASLEVVEPKGERLEVAAVRLARDGSEAMKRQVAALGERQARVRAQALILRSRLEAVRREDAAEKNAPERRLSSLQRRLSRYEAEAAWVRRRFRALAGDRPGRRLQPLDAAAVQSALRAGERLLVYDVGEHDTLLLHVPPEGRSIQARTLTWPGGEPLNAQSLQHAIEQAAQSWSRPMGLAGPADVDVGARLFDALIPGDLRADLGGARRILVVPDGPLHRLAFAALTVTAHTPEAEALLWLDVWPAVVYGHSCTQLMLGRPSRGEPEPGTPRPLAVALGDVQFSRGTAAAAEYLTGREFLPVRGEALNSPSAAPPGSATHPSGGTVEPPPLPASRIEIEAIAAVMRRASQGREVRLLLGDEATASRLYAAADRPRFLHLATHSCATRPGQGDETPDGARGLATTLPPRLTLDDFGVLTAGQLLRDWHGRLAGTELVTLSSCRSALGLSQSGQVGPLTWGFLAAGARSVLATLWDVEDVATAILMERFYRFLLEDGLEKSAALQAAQRALRNMTAAEALEWARSRGCPRPALELLSKLEALHGPAAMPYRDAYYWAPFILIGER